MKVPHLALSSSDRTEHVLGRRLRYILLGEIILIFVLFTLLLTVVVAILSRQNEVNQMSISRFSMALEVQGVEQLLLKHMNYEQSYRLNSKQMVLDELLANHIAFDQRITALSQKLQTLGPDEASFLPEEQKLSRRLAASHHEIILILEKMVGKSLTGSEHNHSGLDSSSITIPLTPAGMEARISRLEEQSFADAGMWQQFVQADIDRLSYQSEVYQRLRLTSLFGLACLMILVLVLVNYTYVLPSFNHILRHVVRQNKQLREVDSLKTEFLSVSSHQLRTPLSELKWALTLLNRHQNKGDLTKQHHFVQQSLHSVDTMSQIVSALLNVSRIEQNRLQFNPVVTDMAPVMRTVINRAKRAAKAKDVTLTFVSPSGGMKAHVDVLLVKQILQNLIDNAIQYNRPHGKVAVIVKKQRASWLISISDTGSGISRKDLKHLFTKFYRGDNARRIRPDGSGLGLYFVKKIVEKHRGKITVSSIEGHGTIFSITLPGVRG
ncbi:MAG TPA: HAMP domain-containing sensor histidine kinase [Patescibacteria group bacterium]